MTERRAAASVSCSRIQHNGAGRTVHHREIARPDRVRQTCRTEHRRHAQRAQHHRGMSLGATLLGGHPGKPRWIEQRRIRRPQRLTDQYSARGQAGEAAVRRSGQIAYQPPADLAHLLGAPHNVGAVVGWHACFGLRLDRSGDRLRLFRNGGFR